MEIFQIKSRLMSNLKKNIFILTLRDEYLNYFMFTGKHNLKLI